MAVFRVLHLSDIHIGNTYINSDDIAYKIVSDLSNNGSYTINSVVVTGDIFDGRIKKYQPLIEEAVSFFELILKAINDSQNKKICKTDFIFVPGNHDLILSDDVNIMWSKYKRFLEKFYEDVPENYDMGNFSVLKAYHDSKILFIGFNSCQIEKRKMFDEKFIKNIEDNLDDEKLIKKGIQKNELIQILKNEVSKSEFDIYGEIPLKQLYEMSGKLRVFNGYKVIALFHHHFYLFPESYKKFGESSLVRNHADLVHRLKCMDVKTILHGHKHYDLERPFITDDYYKTTDSIINVFAAGSVGAEGKDEHTFSVIDFYEEADPIMLKQDKFTYKGSDLKINTKQIPPLNVATKIVELLKILEANDVDTYKEYIEATEKIYKIHQSCENIISWVSEAITGFNNVYKLLEKDNKNTLFLLYAIQFRTLKFKTFKSNEAYYNSSAVILKTFFSEFISCPGLAEYSDDFHCIFEGKNLSACSKRCDELINKIPSKTIQQYLAFSMLGIYFTDLYLVLTEYADDYYNDTIHFKVNIKLEKNKFHENVPATRILIQSDADRRSAYVQLVCKEATAHKMAVLFIKEFDLMINKYEDYFKLIGLKLYYLIPKIEKDNLKDSLDNYNFEAYIPTLLPLLTGDNIYPQKEAFARELIQNSIDAIAVREAKTNDNFDKTIYIEFGKDESNRRYFIITDFGTGMDRHKIERYFTSIGRSFYSGDEYEDLKILYKPISNFGIGFLSSFMVCREIDVLTRHYVPDSEGLMLHIPNYDGCFFIEKDNHAQIGTKLKLYLEDGVSDEEIISYIDEVMLDIKYDINILEKDDNNRKIIKAHMIRKEPYKRGLKFFIPFTETGEVLNVSQGMIDNDELNGEFEYGMLIRSNDCFRENEENQHILNAGILVNQASIYELFGMKRKFYRYGFSQDNLFFNNIVMNFPANWIQLDVSREKSNSFSSFIKKLNDEKEENSIGVRIAEVIYQQLKSVFNDAKDDISKLPIVYVQEIIYLAIKFCGEKAFDTTCKKLNAIRFKLNIELNNQGISYSFKQGVDNNVENLLMIPKNDAKEFLDELEKRTGFILRNKELYKMNENLDQNEPTLKYELRPMFFPFYRFLDSHEDDFEKNVVELVEHYWGRNDIKLEESIIDEMTAFTFAMFPFLNNLCFYESKIGEIKRNKSNGAAFEEVQSSIEMAFLNYFLLEDVFKGVDSKMVSYEDMILFAEMLAK